mmetsp:Transcript_91357/g.190996  ORF Transcript_91357/g.190996 Transcript_91357/m.190996 type:complete len:247 (+) Transcript_91357:197-937(+)
MKAKTSNCRPEEEAFGRRFARSLQAPASTAACCGADPTRVMFANAPALHSAPWIDSVFKISTRAGTAPCAFSAFGTDPAVMFIKAPAAYSRARVSWLWSIFTKCVIASWSARSVFTSGHLQDRFMTPSAASAIPSCSNFSIGGPAPADQTASHGRSSAASIARACTAGRRPSSEMPPADPCCTTATRDGMRSGACVKPAFVFLVWSLKRLPMAPAARSLIRVSSSLRSAAKGASAPASTILSLILG